MINKTYRAGYISRQIGIKKDSCPLPALSSPAAWWLAGWHDADIELIESGKENGKETQKEQRA